jgi:ubiquinone/menaquinone biosynthesis C-methylase UbiE
MSWYDFISPLYDIGATGSGRPRREAVAQLRLEPGDVVLDIACGTGLNFPFILGAIGAEGLLIGLDYSPGMLGKARRKVQRKGWANVRLIQADARALSEDLLKERAGVDSVDAVLCTLGLTVVRDWEAVFERSRALLKPGGRYAIMDWWLERRNLFARLLEFISHGEVGRRCWAPLEEKSEDYSYTTFIRGMVFVAAGTVPGAAL